MNVKQTHKNTRPAWWSALTTTVVTAAILGASIVAAPAATATPGGCLGKCVDPAPPVVAPPAIPAPPVVAPPAIPAPPVVAPPAIPAPPVVAPPAIPAPPVVAPPAIPAPPVVAPPAGSGDVSAKYSGTPPSVVYRVDSRSPEEIFKTGFEALGNNLNLVAHVDFDGQSGFVATTDSKAAIPDIITETGAGLGSEQWLYTIRTTDNFHYVPESLTYIAKHASPDRAQKAREAYNAYAKQREWVAVEKISPTQIKEATRLFPKNPTVPTETNEWYVPKDTRASELLFTDDVADEIRRNRPVDDEDPYGRIVLCDAVIPGRPCGKRPVGPAKPEDPAVSVPPVDPTHPAQPVLPVPPGKPGGEPGKPVDPVVLRGPKASGLDGDVVHGKAKARLKEDIFHDDASLIKALPPRTDKPAGTQDIEASVILVKLKTEALDNLNDKNLGDGDKKLNAAQDLNELVAYLGDNTKAAPGVVTTKIDEFIKGTTPAATRLKAKITDLRNGGVGKLSTGAIAWGLVSTMAKLADKNATTADKAAAVVQLVPYIGPIVGLGTSIASNNTEGIAVNSVILASMLIAQAIPAVGEVVDFAVFVYSIGEGVVTWWKNLDPADKEGWKECASELVPLKALIDIINQGLSTHCRQSVVDTGVAALNTPGGRLIFQPDPKNGLTTHPNRLGEMPGTGVSR